ncbi:MAG: hypothetical protein ACWA6X_01530 [Bauldia sp.]
MKRLIAVTLFGAITAGAFAGMAGAQDYVPANDPDLLAVATALSGTTHTLAEAIAQVAVGTEVPIEAKFEVEDGVFWLSVYTAERGLDVMAEENAFKEYKADATAAQWTPQVEVFADFEHIARSAQYQTLLSMTQVSILEIIEKASALGSVFSVKEKVVDGYPVFEVMTASGGAVTQTLYDLATGEVRANP